MAEYLINATDLTKVASAIKEKGGTSAPLVYPGGFVSAIQAIQTGALLQIIVTTIAGAAVKAMKDSKTVSGTADASGNCTLTVDETGTWTVAATNGSTTKTVDVVVGTTNVDMIMIDPVFGNNSWETIIAACRSGNIPDSWAIGNSKNMTINGTGYQIDIIGKNHDNYADGSGKAPLTFQLHDCYADTKAMNSTHTTSGGWKNSAMRTTHLPAILALMPTEVKNGIREVSKKVSVGGASSTIETVSDKLFLLSEVEIFGSTSYSAAGEGTQYDYYKAGNSKVKKLNGSADSWWERSPTAGGSTNFCAVNNIGYASDIFAGKDKGVAFGFCF